MHAFEYRRAASLSEAVRTLSQDSEARPLAGGMTLIPSLKHRLNQVSQLIDIGGLADLQGIAVRADHLWIGAATRHQQVADSADVARAVPGLACLAGLIGDPQVRTRGTIGGSVANNDPAADYPAAVLALDAVVVTECRELAAAVMVVSEKALKEFNLTPMARVHHMTLIGHDPVIMLEAPLPATERALKKCGMKIDDIDLFEVNEAFASVPVAWLQYTGADRERLNVNGGAIALGHPLGGSGAKLMTTLVYALKNRNKRYGLQTMCEGGGMANVTIIERL